MRARGTTHARPAWLDSSPAEFPREPVRLPCRVTCELIVGGRSYPVYLEDYTSRGFRARCYERLLVGTDVALKLPDCAPVEATVRWSIGGAAGCAFKKAVKPDLIQIAIEAASARCNGSA